MASSVRAAERAAIARELHDLLAHHVSSIVLRVAAARHRGLGGAPHHTGSDDPGDEVDAVLADVHTAATTALAQMQRLLTVLRDADAADHELAPLLEPADLRAALQTLVLRADPTHPTVLHMPDGDERLDAMRALAVLRVVQESLTNVAKHSPATSSTTVSVIEPPESVGSDAVEVEVRTTYRRGPGPPAPRASDEWLATGGWGLAGMHERISMLGGSLRAGPTPDGWCVRATLPATLPTPDPAATQLPSTDRAGAGS